MNFSLHVEDKEADIIFNALAQRPFAEVQALIPKLAQQIQNQNRPVDTTTGQQAGEAVKS